MEEVLEEETPGLKREDSLFFLFLRRRKSVKRRSETN
jgi:hypothetical protein